jgi:hypothetical protein
MRPNGEHLPKVSGASDRSTKSHRHRLLGDLIMWQVKKFSTRKDMLKWCENNSHRYQIEQIFVNNGYAVEYRQLKIIG